MKNFLLTNCLASGNIIIGWIKDYSAEAAMGHPMSQKTYNPHIEEWTDAQILEFEKYNGLVNWL